MALKLRPVTARTIRAVRFLGAVFSGLSVGAFFWHAESCVSVGTRRECATWLEAYAMSDRTLLVVAIPTGVLLLLGSAAAWAVKNKFPDGSTLLRWWCIVTLTTSVLVSCTLPKIL